MVVATMRCSPGWIVSRGIDWMWKQDDYHNGQPGSGTIESCGVDVNSSKDWANVKWDNGKTANYRVGKDDRYDLKTACT